MVGVSRKDMQAIARWVGRLSARARIALAVGLAALVGLLAWSVINGSQQALLEMLQRPDGKGKTALELIDIFG